MIAGLRDVLSGAASRQDLLDFTRRLWPDTSRQGGPFQRHGAAAIVFDSIWNILEREGDGWFVRDADLARYVEWLTLGDDRIPRRSLARSHSTAPEIARQLGGLPTTRLWLDGLAWLEVVRFASPATGRRFAATSSWSLGGPSEAGLDADEEGREVIDDLFDTLGIDDTDVSYCATPPTAGWQLWRQDDHGSRVVVASFTGYAKAMASLGSLERLSHKQTYWVEEARP